MVIWITGISGAGKTTLANHYKKRSKKKLYFLMEMNLENYLIMIFNTH